MNTFSSTVLGGEVNRSRFPWKMEFDLSELEFKSILYSSGNFDFHSSSKVLGLNQH